MNTIMSNEQRLATAAAAIEHVLRRIHESPEVGYYMGFGTESFERLCESYAESHGMTVSAVQSRFAPIRPRNPTDALMKKVEELEERLSGQHCSCDEEDPARYGPESLSSDDMVARVRELLGLHSADPARCVREIAALYTAQDLPINLVLTPA